MSLPKISVVMSVYNGEPYLREAIESILNQTFTDFEFIIINDGSSDNSLEIIKSYNDDRIVLIDQENTGLAKALNNGIKIAKGKYIARMDADDISMPNRLELQYVFMERHPEYVVVGSNATYITQDGEVIYSNLSTKTPKELKGGLPNVCPFIHSSVLMRRKVVISAGGYKDLGKGLYQEDILLWIDLAKKGEFYNMNIPLVKFRYREQSMQTISNTYFRKIMKIIEEYYRTGMINEAKLHDLRQKRIKNGIKQEYEYNMAKKFIKYGNNREMAIRYLKKNLQINRFHIMTYILLIYAILIMPVKN